MDIKSELEKIIRAKSGDKELALFHLGDGDWRLSVGNTSKHVLKFKKNAAVTESI